MTAAPFDIMQFFGTEYGDELLVIEVYVDDEWIPIPEQHQEMNSTVLVVWLQRGVEKIAVSYEDRVVEFDLRQVIIRDGSPLVTTER